jgi:NAD(P)-dependent dehydrogenase (short-subunit alcohol dehydrogenase family)
MERVAIVTAAGHGIGGACAEELRARGYRLGLLSPSGAAEAKAAEWGAVGVTGSVTETADVARLVQATLDRFGRIDAAVVSAGHSGWSLKPTGKPFDPDFAGNLLDIPDEAWHGALDMYVLGAVKVARALTPVFQRQGGGAIVNISAFGAAEPSAAYPLSSVVRRGLSAFVKLYADRYAREGIRMNNLLPGYIEHFDWSEAVKRSIPMGRPGGLGEIARTAAFLLSPDSGYITGQDILADGGLVRAP